MSNNNNNGDKSDDERDDNEKPDNKGVRDILKPVRKGIPPPPPSIGSSSVSSFGGHRPPPAPPSFSNSESSATESRRSVGMSSVSGRSKRTRGDWDEDIDVEESMSHANRRELDDDRHSVRWIPSRRGSGPFGSGPFGSDISPLSYDELVLGRVIGPAQMDNSVDAIYCNSTLLQSLMDIKYDIEDCQDQFYELRTKLNTFHDVKSQKMFQYSDAIKLANIDALMNFQLTNPRDQQGNTLVRNDELLFFVDLCDGPGGFAEYMLWKKKWFCHGFGFTSKHNNKDWVLPVKPHYSTESFDAQYGLFGKKGSGDIHNPEEVDRFMKNVKRSTDARGVHVVLANGGDNSKIDEDLKELHCRFMIMSELMIALNILREGGHFVIRVFDSFTHFTVGLIYLMYRTFDSVAIHRPDTSMTASSERYILCKGRRPWRYAEDVCKYLLDSLTIVKNSNSKFAGRDDDTADILTLIPENKIRSNKSFFEYVYEHNRYFGSEQLKECMEITSTLKQFYGNHISYTPTFVDERRRSIWHKATTMWGIPIEFKHRSEKFAASSTPEIHAMKLIRPYHTNLFSMIERNMEKELNYETVEEEFGSPRDWNFIPVGRGRGFFMGLGGRETYRFMGDNKWERCDKIEMSNNTLVYADVVEEVLIFEDKQIVTTGLHIIDAIILGGKDVRELPYVERAEYAKKFALSMDKPNREDLWAIRAKTPRSVNDIFTCLNMIKNQMLKGGGRGPTKVPILGVDSWNDLTPRYSESKIFKPSGFSFFRTNKGNGAQGNFEYCLKNRLFWRWDEHVSLDVGMKGYEENMREREGPIHAAVLIEHIRTH